ncbi:MAG: hypothetical protein ACO1OB_07555, partial [Archangium sp.]
QGTCDDESTLKLNAQSDVLKAEFPERGFSTVTIELGPPNPALDADRDGWVDSKKGGPDCNDDDRTIFPGGKQACMSSQDTDCDGFLYCDDTDCSAGMLCADPPTRVVIKSTPSPVDMPRHSCNGPFIAELRNAAGTRNAVRNTPITITSSQPGLTFHPSCTSADSTFTIPYDSSEVQFFAKADGVARGPVNVTVAAERVPTAAELQIKVSALPVASIVITSSPDAGVIAGDCMAQTIDFELLDSMNRHTDADDDAIVFNLTAKLGAAPISDFLYSDATCGSAAPTLNFPPGVGNASIRAKSERAGVYDVAAVRGALSAGQAVTVTPAAPSKLQLLNSFLVLSPQVCSNDGFGVTLLDRFNNPVPAPAGTTLTVGTESMIEGVTFHGNVDCLPPATDTVDFPTGQTERRIPTRGTLSRTGRARVSTNLAGVAPTDWLNISVGVGALASLDFGGNGQTIVAAGCSPMPMRFVARDNSGNPTLVPDGGVTIAVTASNPGSDLRFFTSANCTPANGRPDVFIPGGAPALDVYFSGTRARPAFSFSGTNPTYPVDGGVSGNVIYAAPPTRMTLTPDAGTVSAPGCIPFTASLFDSYDNPATFDGGRGFMLTPPAVVVSPTGACAGGGISVPGSQTTFDFFAGSTVAGNYPMSAQTGGLTANAFLAVTPAAPQLSASPTVVSARAGDCVPVTLDRRDMFNNATPVTTNTTFPVTAGARTYVFSQPGCTGAVDAGAVMNANTSTTTFSLRPIEAVSQTVTIDALGGTNPTVALTVTPNDTFRFEFNDAGSPLTLVAGQCSPELRVTRYDVHGNLVTQGNQTAGLTSMNLARFTNSASCATNATITEILIADGQSTSGPFYVTGTLADAGVLRADLGVINGTRAVQVSPAGADHLSFASMAGTAQAGICAGSDLRVELRDQYQNRVTPSGPVTVTLTSDGGVGEGGNPVFFSGAACTTGTTTVQLDGANPTATFRFLS